MTEEQPTIAQQFDALEEVIERRQEQDAKRNEDAWIFWDGYLACLNDLRYIGLKLAAEARAKEE